MSGDHAIEWTFCYGVITGEAKCTAPSGASCRLVGDADCECEEWNVQRDADGPFHLTVAYGDEYEESEVRHAMVDGGFCNAVGYVNDDHPAEFHAGASETFITPVDLVWEEDRYGWRLSRETERAT